MSRPRPDESIVVAAIDVVVAPAGDGIRAAMDAAREEAELQADLKAYRLNVATRRTEADPDWERELEERIADAGRRATP